jgi:hypothetical protein
MLHSPQGLAVRRSQQPARRAMFQACVDSVAPGAPPEDRDRAAAVLQVLYSAASWDLLRSFWDMDAAAAADTIGLGIRCLLSGLALEVSPPATSDDNTPHRSRRKP